MAVLMLSHARKRLVKEGANIRSMRQPLVTRLVKGIEGRVDKRICTLRGAFLMGKIKLLRNTINKHIKMYIIWRLNAHQGVLRT